MSFFKLFAGCFFLLCGALSLCGGIAQAQTKPRILDVGIANPASAIYIGNSFFLLQQQPTRPCGSAYRRGVARLSSSCQLGNHQRFGL
jgi:hypothetical protein